MKSAKILVTACLLLGWQAGPVYGADGAAGTGTPPPDAAALGNDISWPQCGNHLPKPAEFAVIGVNGGRPNTTNPCLLAQLAWAAGTGAAAAGTPVPVYVNTGNPGPGRSWWWPNSNSLDGREVTNPYGTCDGTSTAACAYTYGYVIALNDANLRGVPDPAHRLWWLDVETGNSWSSDARANAADLEGMTAYLQSIGAEVGMYSTGYQLGKVAGSINPESNLNTLRNWIPGATSTATAKGNCASKPLTPGGTIALTQFTSASLDYNLQCTAAAPTLPKAIPVPAPAQTPLPAPTQPPVQRQQGALAALTIN